jgi:hypothetical protein
MWGFIAILYHEYVTMFPPFRSSLQYRVLFSKATQARLRSSLGEAKGTNFHWRHHKLVVGYERSISQMAIKHLLTETI